MKFIYSLLVGIILFVSFIPQITVPYIPKFFFDPKLYMLLIFIIGISTIAKRLGLKSGISQLFKTIEKQLSRSKVSWSLSLYVLALLLTNKILSIFAMKASGADFSHFDYAIWNGYLGNALNVSIVENGMYYISLLGNHFSPILFLFSPLHLIAESHFWCPIIQAVAGWAGIVLLYLFAKYIFSQKKIKSERTLAFFITIAFFSNSYFLKIIRFEFHHEILYIPLGIGLLWAYEKIRFEGATYKHVFISILITLLFLSVKEDSGLILGGFGAYYILILPWRKKIIGVLLGVMGLIYFLACMKILMPAFQLETGSSFIGLWEKYGTNLPDMIRGFITHPHWVFQDLFLTKTTYKLLLPWLFLPLLSPVTIIALPAFFISLTASAPLSSLTLYYSSTIIQFVALGAVYGVAKRQCTKYRQYFVLLLTLIGLTIDLGRFHHPTPKPHVLELRATLEQQVQGLPLTNGNIYISGRLLAQVSFRSEFKRLTDREFYKKDSNISHVIISKHDKSYPLSVTEMQTIANILKNSSDFEKTYEDDLIYVFKKI